MRHLQLDPKTAIVQTFRISSSLLLVVLSISPMVFFTMDSTSACKDFDVSSEISFFFSKALIFFIACCRTLRTATRDFSAASLATFTYCFRLSVVSSGMLTLIVAPLGEIPKPRLEAIRPFSTAGAVVSSKQFTSNVLLSVAVIVATSLSVISEPYASTVTSAMRAGVAFPALMPLKASSSTFSDDPILDSASSISDWVSTSGPSPVSCAPPLSLPPPPRLPPLPFLAATITRLLSLHP
mmetsp:Transcript_25918/g.59885  ORF Transcript_25918/g.59885 Transcript_25918/m.59885 type:complete len:239 (+) Transcript_25918:79-795(+)